MLKDKIPALLQHIESNKEYLAFNKLIFDISEGDLIEKVAELIRSQIARKQSAKKMSERIPPINLLNSIVNKISSLYSESVERTSPEQELVDYYADSVNEDLQEAQRNFNRYKSTCIEIYEDDATKSVETRAIPAYQVLPYSDDPTDSTRMTVMIRLLGKRNGVETYWAYSRDEFISFDEKGGIILADMAENEGVNPFGVIPFVYKQASKNLLIPKPEKDLVQMTLLVCVLLSEINFGNQYLSSPIIYGLDLNLDDSEFNRNPDSIIMLQSNPTKDQSGTLNVLQPNMNIDAQLKLVQEQLDMYLASRDIRAGSMGGETTATQSGISLMLKNMDTSRATKKQARVFRNIEWELWDKLAVIHNSIYDSGRLEIKIPFVKRPDIIVSYDDGTLPTPQGDKIDIATKEVTAGLKSKRTAIKELNPEWDDARIDEELDLIEQENEINV